jgi:hypothetical protein
MPEGQHLPLGVLLGELQLRKDGLHLSHDEIYRGWCLAIRRGRLRFFWHRGAYRVFGLASFFGGRFGSRAC